MSDYIKITNYAAKDALLTGNPSKLVKGTEIGADFDAVAVAVATKFDSTDLGVTVQAYDADLTTWAGVTPGTGIATALAVNVGTAGSPVINGGALGTPSSGTLTNATGLPAAGVTGTALVATGSNLTGGINSARGNITQHATTMDFFATTSPDILDGTGSAVTITACVNAPQAGATRKFYPIVATVLTHGATFDIAGNANLTAAAGDCWEIEAKTVSTYRVKAVKEDGTAIAVLGATEQSLTGYYLPAAGSAYQDCYRAGFLPSWFNQQWGGAQWGTLPDGSFGSVATGNIEDNAAGIIGDGAAGRYFYSEGFKVSETATYNDVWVKVYKVGSPTTNLTLRLYSDSAGSPSAAIGSAVTLSGKAITSKTDGEWYLFSGVNVALTSGTQYHITLNQGASDGTNYFMWKCSIAKKYPHGNANTGTSAPVWTPATTQAQCFLIQNPAANSIIQSAGMFDYKLAFNPGTPVNQSRSLAQPLANFYDGKTCSILYRGTFAVSTNVWDFTYGLDHDRITLTINGSGYPVLTIYESDRTVATVTGTGSVASGNHDVGIRVRTMADGADYATLYVDGVSVGTPLTAQTFTMDAAMVQLGTARLGDGFGLAPTWTQDMQMTSLPSAQGWTFTQNAGTEAAKMSIQNNKLHQNATGYASGETGYYTKTVVFNNTTGWAVSTKMRVPNNPNAVGENSAYLAVIDGTKFVYVIFSEYFLTTNGTGSVDFTVQGDFKSQEHVFTLQGKGSDYYLFIDGKLAVDGTGKLTTANALNLINFGDADNGASQNADAIWSYVKYYQGGMILPTAGANTCSEFAHWSGDKSALFPSLWNSGTPASVKQLCGVQKNYIGEGVVQREVRRGVTSAPTTTSTSAVLLTDMEAYMIGSTISGRHQAVSSNSAGVYSASQQQIDGLSPDTIMALTLPTSAFAELSCDADFSVQLGLHKIEQRWYVGSASTQTGLSIQRRLSIEARS